MKPSNTERISSEDDYPADESRLASGGWQRRLDKDNFPDDLSQPMLRGGTPQYELAGRAVGTAYGGIGLMQQLVRELDLAEAIDERLHLFKVHLPYHESDHVLNLAYNALCGGHLPGRSGTAAAGRSLSQPAGRRADSRSDDGRRLLPALSAREHLTRLASRLRRGAAEGLVAAAGRVLRRSAGSTPTARWCRPAPSASRASTSPTRACGVIIRWCSRWPTRAKCCGWSIAAATGPATKAPPRSSTSASRSAARPAFAKILLRGDTDFSQTTASRSLARARRRAVRVRARR